MEVFYLFFIFFLGTFIGSFLGVVVDRLPIGESILKGRSHCDHCRKTLGVLDLVPVFSFLVLRGKCRYCHKRLSYFYPIIEVVSGVLFVVVLMNSGISNYIEIFYLLFIISELIALFFIDLKYGILPFPIIASATIITFLYQILNTEYFILNNILSATCAFLFFLALFLGTRGRGMGFGDAVYAFFMGLLLGFPKIVLGLYIAFVGGALVALFLILLKRKKLKGSTIPFGPFLVAGTIISLFWGDNLISLTFNLLQFTIK